LAKSFNWQFQEEFRGDKRREGRGIAEKILDISSNDEYHAISAAVYPGAIKSLL
jgi:hypothetical protein